MPSRRLGFDVVDLIPHCKEIRRRLLTENDCIAFAVLDQYVVSLAGTLSIHGESLTAEFTWTPTRGQSVEDELIECKESWQKQLEAVKEWPVVVDLATAEFQQIGGSVQFSVTISADRLEKSLDAIIEHVKKRIEVTRHSARRF
jgi:hypothetical protein